MMSDVNITPLVDVCLVLLISFMITVPMLAHGFEVKLPQTRAARQMPARQDRPPVVISVPKSNNQLRRLDDIVVSVDRSEVSLAALGRMLRQNAAQPPATRRPVYMRADKDLRYEIVMRVMDVAKASGVTNLGMVTQPETPSSSGAER
jgi:biopolymer transport protein ExbD